MEILRFTDVHMSYKRGDVSINRRTGHLHLHLHGRDTSEAMRCVALSEEDQQSLRDWLIEHLGGPSGPAIVTPSPTLRYTETLGDATTELVWEGALPSADDFSAAVRAISGDDDVTPSEPSAEVLQVLARQSGAVHEALELAEESDVRLAAAREARQAVAAILTRHASPDVAWHGDALKRAIEAYEASDPDA